MVALAEIVRQAGPAYRAAFGERMLPSHRKVLGDVVRCRTPALGGSLYRCDDPACGVDHFSFHSCCNRHCPRCQGDQAQRWLEKVRSLLLPCPCYLMTFTLPSLLRSVARSNQRTVYSLLLTEAAATLRELAEDRRWIGGQAAMMALLHTWGRNVCYHVHGHFLLTAGGLSPDGKAWVRPANPKFLMPAYKLSHLFRQRMHRGLERAGLLDAVDPRVWEKRWVVHAQHAGDGEKVAEYLARYVYRVALSEDRIERLENAQVTYRYTHSKSRETRRITLPADVFLARFLQHVLPKGLAKIRYYGLWAPTCRDRLALARELLETGPSVPERGPGEPADGGVREAAANHDLAGRSFEPTVSDSTGELARAKPPRRCPHCKKGQLIFILKLPRARAPP